MDVRGMHLCAFLRFQGHDKGCDRKHQLGLVQSFLRQSSHDSRLRKSQLALRGEVLCLDLSGQNIRFLSSCLPSVNCLKL